MKLLRSIFLPLAVFLVLSSSLFVLPSSTRAIEPFAPFSQEGNPPEDYYFDKIFPLFRYIKPAQLKVYENMDRSRQYEPLEMCGPDQDYRDSECNNLKGEYADECTGGNVDVCYKGLRSGQVAYTAHSDHGTCSVGDGDPEGSVGRCRYIKRPKLGGEITATDFSEITRSLPMTPTDTEGTGDSETPATTTTVGLIYAKLQNEQMRYSGTGTDNPLTWGSHRLQLSQGEQVIKQLMVVIRAKQTKNTVAETGEWPLGWVDWGYQTANGKTLLEIRDALPGNIAGAGQLIVEASDDFFLNAGSLDTISNVSPAIEEVIEIVAAASNQNPQPSWVADLLQAPVYSPSFRQGYVRGSICVFDICCPNPNELCPPLGGPPRALYADTSVSQAFNAALDDLLLNYPLEEGAKIFRNLAAGNQLIRFAGSAAPNAVPSAIHERLSAEIGDPCFKYVPSATGFDWNWFGLKMDYVLPGSFLDPEKKCPDWKIQPELTKETAGAVPQSVLSRLLSLIWGQQEDDVTPIKRHVITIPDAMGQYLSEIEDPVFQIRDTLSENERQNEYNKTLSNIIDASEDMFYAGKGIAVGDAKRRLGLFSCADPDYSSPELTGIEAYALGTRIGCFDTAAVAGGACTGEQFTKLFGETSQTPLPEAVSTVMGSKMFVDGVMNPDLAEAYAQVEKETGVPCEVLAGHHFAEGFTSFFGSNDPAQYSAANGGYVGKAGFLESVRNAAIGILRHPPTSLESLIASMSNFNGGGNSNCQLGFPVNIPWGGCPRQFIGDDDPYATNLLDSRHTNMYLLYCGDFQICNPPKPYGSRPGAYTTALAVHNAVK